ncbi:DnaT-like ssDNA-binding domain-containing protein [Pseudomonas aeruginosa]|uniref:DnaT-like ssDNA-binding domain-containing protein n=1 Tax=Pseudomonas aeruginosa TaxID=287 RepID=UPI00068ADA17|nr:DnaT-like ssDNA-binding domain-containing protein [Pseudomonas aeruginosa]HEJ9830432.1 hypothetical protein [Pseudomonas aeruginosa]
MSRVAILRGQNTMPLQALLERPVAYHRAFVALGAGVTGALMLSQAVYWSSRTNDADGWFYKSQVEWEEETGLTRYEQEGARKKLIKLGVLEERKQGVPCKLFFRVCMDVLSASLVAENQQSSMRKTSKLDCCEPAGCDAENQQAITEITTETTSSSVQGAQVADIFEGSQYRPMTLGWKPDSKALKAYAFSQGVSLALITDELIAAFTCHHSAHPENHDTNAGWTNRLVKWAKNERARSASSVALGNNVPVQEIVDLYHKTCSGLAPVTVIDTKVKALVAERWNEHEVHQDMDFWSEYFIQASAIKEVYHAGRRRQPYFEALMSRDVFREITEGRHHA